MYDNKGSMRKSIFLSSFLLYSACHSSDLLLNPQRSSCAAYSSVEMSFLTSTESRFSSCCDMVADTLLVVQSMRENASMYCEIRAGKQSSEQLYRLFFTERSVGHAPCYLAVQNLWGIRGSHNLIGIRPMTSILARCTKHRRETRRTSPNSFVSAILQNNIHTSFCPSTMRVITR